MTMTRMQDIQIQLGAEFEGHSTVPVSFGNDAMALQAARSGVAICDRSHWGRLQLSGADRLTFLHNQSTNNLNRLKPGEGCDTVLVTPTARTIDLATAYVLDDTLLLLVSPNRRERLLKWLDRYIFFGDKVTLTDVTDQTAAFTLVGPESHSLLQRIGLSMLDARSDASHRCVRLAEQDVRIAMGSGLAIPGYTLFVAADGAAAVWHVLVESGAVPFGDRVWERLRIEQGRPAPDHELTEDYNPLEAGLWQTISFDKGCYIGQETIARLNTYNGVKQRLWGLQLSSPAAIGSLITLENEKVGTLTSVTQTEQGVFGMGYIRTKAGGAGLRVQVGDVEGCVVAVPFLQHDRRD